MIGMIPNPPSTAQPVRSMSIEEFLELDDDLRRYVWGRGSVREVVKCGMIDNAEKVAFYKSNTTVKINNQGKFYKKDKLVEWIVYNKSTKKVKLSQENRRIFEYFINYYFRYPEIVRGLITKSSATFCKRVVEGKIKSIKDILSYHRSYTVRDKSIPLEAILRFQLAGAINFIHCFSDPNEVREVKEACNKIPYDLGFSKALKVSIDEIDNVKDKYDKWIKEQSERYAALLRSRNEDDGSKFSEELF